MQNTILTVIVTYNAMKWIERCLNSLRESTITPDMFIVDNGSTDGTQSYIREHYPEIMFHQSKENLGFGRANNMGLQYALDHDYDYVYLLNQDAWVMPETLENLIAFSKSQPGYGILGPFQMNDCQNHIDKHFIVHTLAWQSNPDIMNDLYNQQLKEVYPVKEVMAAHWLMTKECIRKVGGFSPSFYHYGEDCNYIDRVHYWGLKVGVVPSLHVVHDREWREDSPSKMMFMGYSSCIRLLSNPQEQVWRAWLKVLLTETRQAIVFRSLRPFRYLMKLIVDSRRVLKIKKASIDRECAFLTLQV